ncbi:MAG: type III pantothenate kinase [Salibacteraceae bacterium]|jgi:type III pantothenate kinase|nr:type III pantothenate kinase [Salibacteraceae bacterium]MDP4687452.1 type III pantothenate kinase [Salibacteraceae bacterium]MDP4764240.1 type III pantothenate kinase [Salibacteraceae bacterium]MDP4844074.1 type III pantothenate kinase [Salibacteraceae bacterium]MDP4934974.1 type III pantothenate kinase [Salibacteraceae bacterium]
MNLIIDIGNTATKIALFSENQIITNDRFLEKIDKNWFEKILSEHEFELAIVSSTKILDDESAGFLNKKGVTILSHDTPLPIVLDYKTPETLGRDRIAGAVAAKYYFPNDDCLIVDLGTCITYDFVSKQNIYRGGAISPGLKMRFHAMNKYTDKLPLIEKPSFIDEFGQSTTESLNMGAFNGMAHEINGFIRLFKHKSARLKVILTGGDTSLFEQHIENAIFAAPNLILDGLNQVLLYNKQLNE